VELKEFYETLIKIKYQYWWSVDDKGRIRGLRINNDHTCHGCCIGNFCPISAVAREVKLASYPDYIVGWAALSLGLAQKDALNIIASADNEKAHDKYHRDTLIKILGLERS
jgi:hypothetical protein